MDFTDSQLERYARHIMLPEVGGVGQERLLRARVLVVGAGGLGSPLLLYLAAAGVGTLGVVDPDVVDLSNLQRQVIHDGGSLGRPKVDSAAARIRAINPDVTVEPHHAKLTAILRFEGQISTFKPHAGPDHPCYRCLFPEPPPPGLVPSCAEGGVFGALAGAVGSFQAIEVLKEVLGIGDSLSGHLLLIDALGAVFRKIRVPRDPACPLCGAA